MKQKLKQLFHSDLMYLLPLLFAVIVIAIVVGTAPEQTAPDTAKPTEIITEPSEIPLSSIDTDFTHGGTIGHLSSKDFALDCDLVYGTTDSDLWNGAGLHTESSLPGFATPPMIAGHARIDFTGFADAKVGDVITIEMPYGTYEYKISEILIRNMYDFPWESLNEKTGQAIFYACYPFYKTNYVKTDRIFFYADPISGPDVVDSNGERAVTPGYLAGIS